MSETYENRLSDMMIKLENGIDDVIRNAYCGKRGKLYDRTIFEITSWIGEGAVKLYDAAVSLWSANIIASEEYGRIRYVYKRIREKKAAMLENLTDIPFKEGEKVLENIYAGQKQDNLSCSKLTLLYRRCGLDFYCYNFREQSDGFINKEIGTCHCRIEKDALYIDYFSVFIKTRQVQELSERIHIGTNFLIQTLLNMYERFQYSSVIGMMSHLDTWDSWNAGIPFFKNFPQYLPANAPFVLKIEFSDNKYFSCILPEQDIDALIQMYREQDLYFRYTVKKKV